MKQLSKDQIAHCTNLARKYCPDLFRASLFAHADTRPYIWAVLAFYGEISQVKYQVSQIEMGQIRLQWWRDEIAKIFDGDVDMSGQSLSSCISVVAQNYQGRLRADDFLAVIDGLDQDLAITIPQDLPDFHSLAMSIYAPLLRVIGKMLEQGGDNSPSGIDDAALATKIAQAFGVVDMMMHFPRHVRMGRCYLPDQMIKDYGISLSAIMHLKDDDKDLHQKLPKIVDDILVSVENNLKSATNNRFFEVLRRTCMLHMHNIRKRRGNVLVSPRPIYHMILPIKLWWRC